MKFPILRVDEALPDLRLRSIATPADKNRSTEEPGIIALFDRRMERIHIAVNDLP
jgi:hypothetical protein